MTVPSRKRARRIRMVMMIFLDREVGGFEECVWCRWEDMVRDRKREWGAGAFGVVGEGTTERETRRRG